MANDSNTVINENRLTQQLSNSRSGKDIFIPSRRLLLGAMVGGGAAVLTGCSVTQTIFNFAMNTAANAVAKKVIAGRKARKVAQRKVQRRRKAAPVIAKKERQIHLFNTHTGEKLDVAYWQDGRYQPEALREINVLLRDHRSNDVHRIDNKLLDQLFVLRNKLDTKKPIHILSGYRSPKTNEMLRKRGGGGVAKRSLHMSGKAIDIRVPGKSLNKVRLAALSMQAGGVGYYQGSQFVHLDTGRVRRW